MTSESERTEWVYEKIVVKTIERSLTPEQEDKIGKAIREYSKVLDEVSETLQYLNDQMDMPMGSRVNGMTMYQLTEKQAQANDKLEDLTRTIEELFG